MIFINRVFMMPLIILVCSPIVEAILIKFGLAIGVEWIWGYIIVEALIVIVYYKKIIEIRKEETKDITLKEIFRILVIAKCIGLIIGWVFTTFKLHSADIEMNTLAIAYMLWIAPIMEELVFRGVCIGILKDYDEEVKAIMSALAFSLFHMNFAQCVVAFVIGYMLAKVRLRTGTLFWCIIIHMLNNLLGLYLNMEYTLMTMLVAIIVLAIVKLPKIKMKEILNNISATGVLCLIIFILISTSSLIAKNL